MVAAMNSKKLQEKEVAEGGGGVGTWVEASE